MAATARERGKGKTHLTTTIFTDIGGVLGTNGWDEHMRALAAAKFGLDLSQMERRHQRELEALELGRLNLDEYLSRVVFYRKRPFSRKQFKAFMLAQSLPYPEMLGMMCQLKARHGVKIVVVSNEGRDLMLYRIEKFGLRDFVDVLIGSCFVHYRKPDPEIFKMALEIAQVEAKHVFYIEDRAPFVKAAARLGIRGIQHTRYETTRAELATLGLSLLTGVRPGALVRGLG